MGLAKALTSNNGMTNTFAGTPLAMAPEVVTNKNYSFKADVWSLGTILFQMLTNEYPFNGRNLTELKKNLKKGEYKIPKNIDISMNCANFLNSCLKLDSNKRSDWEELKEEPFLNVKTENIGILDETLMMNARKSVNLFEAFRNKINK